MTSAGRAIRFAALLGAGFACLAVHAATMEEHIVEGSRPAVERRINTFVAGMTHGGFAVEPLARWNVPICPLVAGLPAEQGEFILQRVSQALVAAETPLGPSDCKPNLHIVFTAEPEQLLSQWLKRAPRLFGGETPSQVRRVMETPRPIRVWHNVGGTCAGGEHNRTHDGGDTLGMSKLQGGDCRLNDSRLSFSHANGISSVITIVDFDEIKQVGLGALADYIVMVGAAKLDLDGERGDAPTILRLFTAPGDAAPPGMSDWDRAFLKALYKTSQDSRSQRTAISEQMLRDLLPKESTDHGG